MGQPQWFNCVACVILYRVKDGDIQYLLGKRRDGKWALVGGSGAFEVARDPFDFAVRETLYDLNIDIFPEKLEYFSSKANCTQGFLGVENYFSYQVKEDEEIEATGFERAPTEARWFSMEEIGEMAERGEMAFDNDVVLNDFNQKVLGADSKTG